MGDSTKNLIILILLFFLIAVVPFCTGSYSAETSSDKGLMDSLFGKEDATPPDIELDDLSDGQTVYTEKIYISGYITDAGTVGTITVNERPVAVHKGKNIVFSYLAALKEGKNIITIEAADESGNRTKKDLTVIRENLRLLKLPKVVFEKRMRLAVYSFEQKGAVSEASTVFMDLLTLALQNQHRFQLVERVSLDRALEEQKLSLSQVIDRNAALNIGKLMSAQAIVTGSIMESGEGIEVVARLIDTETSEILTTEKLYSAGEGIAGMSFLAQALAAKFCNDIPMLGGIVVDRNGESIFTSLGDGKVSQNSRIMVYRDYDTETDGDKGPKSVILGHGRITQVMQDMSKAKLFQGSPDAVRKLDWVIVQ
jgi:TolB-like protein